jgi:S-adenosylmethionine:tRNA ribosyltransferase-isomerase
MLTGVHERGTSHHEMLRAFVDAATLEDADEWLEQNRYRTHEFGDSVFVERGRHR